MEGPYSIFQEDSLYSDLCESTANLTVDALSSFKHGPSFEKENLTQHHNDTNGTTLFTKHPNRCTKQKVQLSVSFTVGIVCFGLGGLPLGLFFDRFGLRMTRTMTA